MYFIEETEVSKKTIAPGVDIRVISGEKAQMSFVSLAPGSQVPMHRHPHEQIGVVMEGSFDLVVDGQRKTLGKGDTYVIPGGVEHGVVEVKTPSVALDIFSPPREEYR
ncbi:MAG: cupin domain-containing protein [candidate division Zixibacteria bacterium]|nr:cupin domain-containing protein [candidate division Zixibacteria bacterium]